MNFYIILTLDSVHDSSTFCPNHYKSADKILNALCRAKNVHFQLTEYDNGKTEVASCLDMPRGLHKKYAGEISKDDFDRLNEELYMFFEDVEKMGSLTLDRGFIPAFSFRDEADYLYSGVRYASARAYVTPFPDGDPPETQEEAQKFWDELRQQLKTEYGY